MFILMTNDDGIDSSGLRLLVREAVRRGHRVLCCAPAAQQSAASQRIQLNTPIMVHRVPDLEGAEAWAVSGTPADCVRIALELCDCRPDVCVSGINDGENAGCAVFYSGTIAAAREGAMHGIPAFAVSIMPHADEEMTTALADRALTLAEHCRLDRFPRLAVVNLNAPALPADSWKGIRYCPVSQAFYRDTYERRTSPRGQDYFWLSAGLPMETPEPGTDYDLLRQGYLTVSVLGGYSDMNAQADRFLTLDPQESCHAR